MEGKERAVVVVMLAGFGAGGKGHGHEACLEVKSEVNLECSDNATM